MQPESINNEQSSFATVLLKNESAVLLQDSTELHNFSATSPTKKYFIFFNSSQISIQTFQVFPLKLSV